LDEREVAARKDHAAKEQTPWKDRELDLERALAAMSFRSREVFKLRNGLGDGYVYTCQEIGRIFRLPSETITRIHSQAQARVLAILDIQQKIEPGSIAQLQDVLSSVRALSPWLIAHLQGRERDLRQLPWELFESLVAEFFASWGYSVEPAGRNQLTGADIIAVRKPDQSGVAVKYFVEVKRQKERVGVQVVDRLLGAVAAERSKQGWHLGMIVSLAGFTDFRKYSNSDIKMLGVELRDESDVVKWLRNYKPSDKGLWLPTPCSW
jgi:hypothetical protein